MNFNNGIINNNNKSNTRYVRPVLAYRNNTCRSDVVVFIQTLNYNGTE